MIKKQPLQVRIVPQKEYIIKTLVENLSKHTNSFYKVNRKNNNSSYTDANSQNDQPFVSPKNKNTK